MKTPEAPPIQTLSSREVYRNPWMTVQEDIIRRQDGTEGLYGVVRKADFSLVIPYEAGAFYLVDQYRYPVRVRTLEFPQGAWEDREDASPEEVAAGELREETGLRAGRMRYVGRVLAATGYSNQAMHVFLAEQLTAGPPQLSSEEQGLVCVRVEVARFVELMRGGHIEDTSTLAAYALLQVHGLVPLPAPASR